MAFTCRQGDLSPRPEEAVVPSGEEELGADPVTDEELNIDLKDELGADLDDELEVDLDEELDVDLEEELEVDEDESSTCAPYLACQMSCLGPRTPGVKDTPFLGLARGAKEAGRRLLPG